VQGNLHIEFTAGEGILALIDPFNAIEAMGDKTVFVNRTGVR
jgi:hypothetical protein